jgi:hypothetical protein
MLEENSPPDGVLIVKRQVTTAESVLLSMQIELKL